jgi:hypothetical protein
MMMTLVLVITQIASNLTWLHTAPIGLPLMSLMAMGSPVSKPCSSKPPWCLAWRRRLGGGGLAARWLGGGLAVGWLGGLAVAWRLGGTGLSGLAGRGLAGGLAAWRQRHAVAAAATASDSGSGSGLAGGPSTRASQSSAPLLAG